MRVQHRLTLFSLSGALLAASCGLVGTEDPSTVLVDISYHNVEDLDHRVDFVVAFDEGAALVGTEATFVKPFERDEADTSDDPADEDGSLNVLGLTLLDAGSNRVEVVELPSWVSGGDALTFDGSKLIAFGSTASSSDVRIAQYDLSAETWSDEHVNAGNSSLIYRPPSSQVGGDVVLDMTNSFVVLNEGPSQLDVRLFGGNVGLRSRIVTAGRDGHGFVAAWSNGKLRLFQWEGSSRMPHEMRVSTRDTAFADSTVPLGLDLASVGSRLFLLGLFDDSLHIYEVDENVRQLSSVQSLELDGGRARRDGGRRIFVRGFAGRFMAVVTGDGELLLYDSIDSKAERIDLDEVASCHLGGAIDSTVSEESLRLVAFSDQCDDRRSLQLTLTPPESK